LGLKEEIEKKYFFYKKSKNKKLEIKIIRNEVEIQTTKRVKL
jgi:hypothetical protein